ncbi:MAG: hypothetical protein J5J06_14610 [Phycisphaerae bacterium]|nr:hypothetical protein [Phycisphaerae bacterium]
MSRASCQLFVLALAVITFGGCNNLDPVQNDNTAGSEQGVPDNENSSANDPECDLPFDGIGIHDGWLISADPKANDQFNLAISGMGAQVQDITFSDPSGELVNCYGTNPTINMIVDNRRFSLESTFENTDYTGETESEDGSPQMCVLRISGTIASCGNDLGPGFGLELQVFAISGGGTAGAGGIEYTLTDFDLTIIPAPEVEGCTNEPTSLDGRMWSVTLYDPILLFENGVASGDVFVDVSGTGDAIETASAEIYPDFEDPNGVMLSCFTDAPSGTVQYDGQSLSIDVPLAAEAYDKDGNPVPEDGCRVSFSGVRLDCRETDSIYGLPTLPAPFQVIAFSGGGSITSGDITYALDTLYLSLLPEGTLPDFGTFKAVTAP